MDVVGKQRAWGDMNRRDITINKTGLKWGHTKRMHVNKEMPTGWHYGQNFQTLSGQLARLGASLKCLYTTACSTGNKQEELKVCVHLQGYDLIDITEKWKDSSHEESAVWMDTSSLGRAGHEGKEGKLPCMQESSWKAWSSAWGWVMSQLRVYRLGLVGRPTWMTLLCVSAIDQLIRKKR